MCNCDTRLKHYDTAIPECQKALSYDSQDAMTHWALGLAYMHKASDTGKIEVASAARDQFAEMGVAISTRGFGDRIYSQNADRGIPRSE